MENPLLQTEISTSETLKLALSLEGDNRTQINELIKDLINTIHNQFEDQIEHSDVRLFHFNGHDQSTPTLRDTESSHDSAKPATGTKTQSNNILSINSNHDRQEDTDSSPDDNSCDLVIDASIPSGENDDTSSDQAQSDTEQQPVQSKPTPMQEDKTDDTQKVETPGPKSNSDQQSPLAKDDKSHIPHNATSIDERNEPNVLETATAAATKLDEIVSTSNVVEDLNDFNEEKAKDIVTLEKLAFTPPTKPSTPAPVDNEDDKINRRKKRAHTSSVTPDDQNTTEATGGRSKRQRTQTQLFQAGVAINDSNTSTRSRPARRDRKRSTGSSSTHSEVSKVQEPTAPIVNNANTEIPPDVIFYEKNDYLAIRNEENSFYLCQLAENVRFQRPMVKVKWLDTKDDGKTYFLTAHFDQVPQKSIIMPVTLERSRNDKKGKLAFTLLDEVREGIMDRLKRSLSATLESTTKSSDPVT